LKDNYQKKYKVFVVGASKTGTSSLESMLNFLGYKTCGPKKDLLKKIQSGDLDSINETLDQFDAFEDWPWPLVYEHVHKKYKMRSKFILSKRIDSDTWFRSINDHGRTMRLFASMSNVYGFYRPFGKKKEFIEFYEKHNNSVRQYFANFPNQIIEFCFEEGDGWNKLCSFLGEEVPIIPIPHQNKSNKSRKPVRRFFNKIIESIKT
jgi:hypothetical protein